MQNALRTGITVADFWGMTPRETWAAMDAAAWRMEQEQRNRAWLAWHTAALSRAKRMPPLSKLLRSDHPQVLTGEALKRRRAERDDLLSTLNLDKLNEAMRKRNGS